MRRRKSCQVSIGTSNPGAFLNCKVHSRAKGQSILSPPQGEEETPATLSTRNTLLYNRQGHRSSTLFLATTRVSFEPSSRPNPFLRSLNFLFSQRKHITMSGIPARFWGQPITYLRWAAHEKPAIFWSCVIGACAPLSFVVIPPLRRWAGDSDPPRIPLTYPGMFYTLYRGGR